MSKSRLGRWETVSTALDPYPFRDDGLEVSFTGRHLTPFGADDKPDMAAVMRETPRERQGARLVAA